MRELRTIWVWPILIVSSIVTADQASKAWIWNQFGPIPVEGDSMPLWGEWLRFTFVKNTGVAFGMFQDFPQFFTVTSILISLGAIYYYRFHLPHRSWVVQICLGLIVGGAIGNIIDRLRLGYVIDFVHISWFPGIFNLADSSISIGTILLSIYILLTGEQQAPQSGSVNPTPDSDDDRRLGESR
jgi:signal peptidase II